MSPPNLLHCRLMALAAPVCWSAAGVTVKLMEEAGAWQVTFFRSATLALFMLVVLWLRYRRNTWNAIRATGWRGPLAGVAVGLAMLGNIYALNHTTVTSVTLLMASSPVFGAVLGWLMLRERVGSATWLAVALAVAGGVVMVGGSVATGGLLGNLVALFSVFCFGLYSVILRKGQDIDMTPAVLYGGVFAGLVGAAVAALGAAGFTGTAADIGRCVALGLFQIGLGSQIEDGERIDTALAEDWLALLQAQEVDFTLAWRRLADAAAGDAAPLQSLFTEPAALAPWLQRWRERCAQEDGVDGAAGAQARAARMRRVNPWIIPRNHRVEEALAAASAQGDLGPFNRLLMALQRPFDDDPAVAHFAEPASAQVTAAYQTYCGT